PDVRALVTQAAEAPLAARLDPPRAIRFVRITVGTFDSAIRDVALFAPAPGAAHGTTRGSPKPVRSSVAGTPGGVDTRSTSSAARPFQGDRSTATSVQRRSSDTR